MIVEKTRKEEWTYKNYFNDNYNYITIDDTILISQLFDFER